MPLSGADRESQRWHEKLKLDKENCHKYQKTESERYRMGKGQTKKHKLSV
jgi:hypothetical protein